MRDVPPAEGVRLEWDAVPSEIRNEVATIMGSPVIAAVTQPLGFSPGVAVRLETMSGRRAFAKAVPPSPNTISPLLHRHEIKVLRAMPTAAPIAHLVEAIDHGPDGSVVLVLEDVDAAAPALPWQPAQLTLALEAVEALHDGLTPPPTDFGLAAGLLASPKFQRWRTATGAELDQLDPWTRDNIDLLVDLETRAPEASRGNTLLHLDLRADNLLVNSKRAWVVDWAHAATGAPWVDYVAFAASVEMQAALPATSSFRWRRRTEWAIRTR